MSENTHPALELAIKYSSSYLFADVGLADRDSVDAMNELCHIYRDQQICLFTGAGISFNETERYRIPGWWGLLEEIYGEIRPELTCKKQRDKFQALRKKHKRPWEIADVLAKYAGGNSAFIEKLRRMLVKWSGSDNDQRLPRYYLENAWSLNAAIAFCSQLKAIRKHPCYSPNSKIRAVMTINYDWFLEGGGTTKHQADHFEPITFASQGESIGKLPVYHIHGYIPYDRRKILRRNLVMSSQAYRLAYSEFGETRKMLGLFMPTFPTLFIGVSFDDPLLLKWLARSTEQDHAIKLFALLKQGSCTPRRIEELRVANIQPIFYARHELIPTLLGQVYQAGLREIDLAISTKVEPGTLTISREQYWKLLLFNKK